MTAARVFHVVVELLDHQMIDRDGHLAGKVDDLELEVAPDGTATVRALLSGPGVLARRLGHRRYGDWRERMESTLEPPGERTTRIPLRHARRIDQAVHLDLPLEQLASTGSERWVRDHVISHIPGATVEGGGS